MNVKCVYKKEKPQNLEVILIRKEWFRERDDSPQTINLDLNESFMSSENK